MDETTAEAMTWNGGPSLHPKNPWSCASHPHVCQESQEKFTFFGTQRNDAKNLPRQN